MTESDLSLHEAATLLGVHYMTAYRYVRLGLLPAAKVGGVWHVSSSDLEEFRERQGGRGTAQPVTWPAEDSDDVDADGGDAPTRPGRLRAPWADRIESRLLVGDVRGAWSVVEAALAAGATLADVYLQVLAPALVSIGERWANGEIDISDEHRASGIAMRLIGRLGPRFARRGRSRGVVLLGCPAGEQHTLSMAMMADLIRQRGWEVSDLGSDLPPASFVRAVTNIGADLVAVGLSVSVEDHLPAAEATITALRAACSDALVIIGGRVVHGDDHAHALGADHYSPSLDGVLEILEQGVSAPD